ATSVGKLKRPEALPWLPYLPEGATGPGLSVKEKSCAPAGLVSLVMVTCAVPTLLNTHSTSSAAASVRVTSFWFSSGLPPSHTRLLSPQPSGKRSPIRYVPGDRSSQ